MDIQKQAEALRRGTGGIVPERGLEEKLARSAREGKPLVIKLGLDPTAPDIHLGTAVVLRKLRQFQDLGHRVVVIIGDFTAAIGDPSGRNETRRQLTAEEVRANAATYEAQYHRILDPARTEIRFNSEWLGAMGFSDVIRLASRMTVAQVMERDDFTKRWRDGRPIGLHELLYPLCQAYDSVVLEADIEMGGTDQMFNILAGRALQGQFGQDPQVALFTPLLVGLDGVQKMSKSLGNYVGITEPPDVMFGKLMSISDEAMPTYFELATAIPMGEVRGLLEDAAAGRRNPKDVKRRLARTVVATYHGEEAAALADAEFERIHARGEMPADMPELTVSPDLARSGGVWVCRLLVAAGLARGTGDARRLVEQGGVHVDGERVTSPDAELPLESLDGATLQVGSRRFVRLRLGPH
ncbi:MAG: tyrosine--tRNA ligase [Chthonomonadales bacterium]|nr:tyrosine--tRNA ligase [Chthonomonadales bacterium]